MAGTVGQTKKEVIIDFSILNQDALNTIEEVSKKLENLKKWQKQLEEQGQKNTETYIKNAAAIRDYTAVLKANEKELDNNIKAQREEGDSLNAMRADLRSLINEFADLSKEEREASKGTELLKKIDAQRDAVEELEHKLGDYGRQVGDYEKALSKLGVGAGKMSTLFTQLGKGTMSVGKAFKAGVGVVKSFGKELLTLLANPIVAVLTAIAFVVLKIVQAFKKNEEAVAKVQKAFKAFEPVLAVVDKLMNGLADIIASIVEGVGKLATSFARLVFPDWVGEAEKARAYAEAQKDAMEGAQEEAEVIGNTLIREGRRDRDVNKVAKGYQTLINAQIAIEDKAYQEWYNLHQRRNELSVEEMDNLKKLNAIYQREMDKRIQLEENKQIAIEQVNKEIADGEKKIADDNRKRAEDRKKKAEEEEAERLRKAKLRAEFEEEMAFHIINAEADAYEQQRIQISDTFDKRIKEAKEKYKELGLTTEEWAKFEKALYEQRDYEISQVDAKEIESIKKLREQIANINLNPIELSTQEQVEILKTLRNQLEAMYNDAMLAVEQNGTVEQYERLLEVKQKLLDINNQIAQQEEQLNIEEEQQAQQRIQNTAAVLSSMQQVVGGLSDIFGALAEDNEKFAKYTQALSITEAIIAGTLASVQAIATATRSSATWVDMLVAIVTVVSAVGAVVATAISTMKKQSVKQAPKFADGGLVGNQVTERRDDSVNAKLSYGEYVINSKKVKEYGVGFFDRINYGKGHSHMNAMRAYAEGGYVGTADIDSMKLAFATVIEDMPNPIVDVREITDKQNRVRVKENL